MSTFATLFKNEMKLNIRNMNMVIFAVIMPLVILVILGFIYGTKPVEEGAEYTFLEQSFGALCTVSICAGGLMGLPLVVAEYRERKILKCFRVTPVSPMMLLFCGIFHLHCVLHRVNDNTFFSGGFDLECAYKRLYGGVSGQLAVDNGIDTQHWNDGGRHCKKLKKCGRYRFCFVLSHAYFFGCNAAL